MFFATEIDLAAVLTSLATLVTAIGWAFAQYRTHNVAKQTLESVGPVNGENTKAGIDRVGTLETYTHDAIHELRNTLQPIVGALPQLVEDVAAIKAEQGKVATALASTGDEATDVPTSTPRPHKSR